MKRHCLFTVKRSAKCAVRSVATTTAAAASAATTAAAAAAAPSAFAAPSKVNRAGQDYNCNYDIIHSNPMKRHCQFTVKRSEKRGV